MNDEKYFQEIEKIAKEMNTFPVGEAYKKLVKKAEKVFTQKINEFIEGSDLNPNNKEKFDFTIDLSNDECDIISHIRYEFEVILVEKVEEHFKEQYPVFFEDSDINTHELGNYIMYCYFYK